jgi:hypothetical protein
MRQAGIVQDHFRPEDLLCKPSIGYGKTLVTDKGDIPGIGPYHVSRHASPFMDSIGNPTSPASN